VDFPLPPAELIARVNLGPDPDAFLVSGRRSAEALRLALVGIGLEIDSFQRILEWGCGPGRVLRWLHTFAPDAEFFGADIDRLSIEWDREHLPFGSFTHIEPNPPLPYADGEFDLVIGRSVLTHLDEGFQDRWLAELHRVCRPDGTVVLTVHGEYSFALMETSRRSLGDDARPWRQTLMRRGILFVDDDDWTGGPYPDFYHTTFHAPWYVFAHWSRFFELRAYLPRADLDQQDVVVLRRRRDEEDANPAIEPAIDDRQPQTAAGDPPPEVGAEIALSAFEHAQELIETGARLNSPTSHGALSRAWRRIVGRATRHATDHQREVDRAFLDILGLGAEGGSRGVVVQAVLKKQGDRIGRAEEHVFDGLRALEARVHRLERAGSDNEEPTGNATGKGA
jgi:SAM-dependent methyltransferase